jgi:hypothetical protein
VDRLGPARLALLLGVATNEIGGGGRLNIIAFPLMGMLAWNLAVYGLLLAAWVRRLGRGATAEAAGDLRGELWDGR